MWFFIFLLGITALSTAFGYLAIKGDDPDWTVFYACLIGGVIFGAVAGFVFCHFNKKKLKGFVKQKGAALYYRDNSMDLRVKKDIYLYTKTRVIHHDPPPSNGKRR